MQLTSEKLQELSAGHGEWNADMTKVRLTCLNLGFCLPKTSLRSLCYSLVYPYLIYCVSVLGSTYQSKSDYCSAKGLRPYVPCAIV